MKSLLEPVEINGWTIGVRRPLTPGPNPVLLMLHGWTGDENSMAVFLPRLPKNALLIAPRGLYPTPLGGYGWHAFKKDYWPWVDDFSSAIDAVLTLLTQDNFPEGDFSRLNLIGFSQGAACSYALSLEHPWLVSTIAGLSGFLPEGASALARNKPLLGKRVFIAHGTQDKLVPVDRARQSASILQEAGADVTYCEDEVGHKLSANCFRGLEAFLSSIDG